jgi:hypothetical protein
MKLRQNGMFLVLVVSVWVLIAAGCNKPAANNESNAGAAGNDAVAEEGHNLDGWWCAEHGLPEEECSLCSTEVAEKLKAKGDWCKEHDRAESQCFICHPELEAKFAARYEAKFGKKPPKRTE